MFIHCCAGSVPSVILCSIVFCHLWLYWLELPSMELQADYQLAVYLYGISCVVESLAEPVYHFSQVFLYVGWKVSNNKTMFDVLFISYVLLFLAFCRYRDVVHEGWDIGDHSTLLPSSHNPIHGLWTACHIHHLLCSVLVLLLPSIQEEGQNAER